MTSFNRKIYSMKNNITTIIWVCAASALTVFAQDTNNASTPSPLRTGPIKDEKYYEALKKWNATEKKNIAEIEWIAHTVFTPAEDKQYRSIERIVSKSPEVQAAKQAQRDAGFAAMCKADPTIAPVTEKLETAYKTMSEREAMATLTPEEKAHYDKVFPAALRSPEAKAAAQAYKDAVRAAAIKADPINGQLIDRLESSYKILRADFRYESATKKPEQKPAPTPQ